MDKIQLTAPEGCEVFSVAGEEYSVENDGTVKVPASHVVVLVGAHGFSYPVVSQQPPKARASATGKGVGTATGANAANAPAAPWLSPKE